MRRAALVACVVLSGAGLAPADDSTDAAARALEAVRRGDTEGAVRESDASVAAASPSPWSWSVRGYVLSAAGRREEALAAYERAAQLDPRDAASRTNRGSVLLAMGRPAEALDAFAQAAGLDPRAARAHNGRGAALERLGRLEEARAAYEAAAAVDPQDALVQNNLAALAARRGDVRDAASRWERAAAAAPPGFDAPRANLALLSVLTGNAAAAPQVLEAGRRPDASAGARARARAIEAAEAGRAHRWDEAKRAGLEALSLDPDDPSVLNNLAVAEDQLGERAAALSHLDAARTLAPGDARILNNAGIVHVHLGDLARAEETFLEAVRVDPRFHRAHYNLGVVLAAHGDRPAAVIAMRRAYVLAPDDAAVVYNLAVLARRAGLDPAGERTAYERAVALDPDLAEAHLGLGTFLADPATPAALRDETRARTHLRRFLDLALPTDADGRRQATQWLDWLDAPRSGS